MKSLKQLTLAASTIILASQVSASEPLPVEVDGRVWQNSRNAVTDDRVVLERTAAAVQSQPTVETILGCAAAVCAPGWNSLPASEIETYSARPAVEAVIGRAGVIPVSVRIRNPRLLLPPWSRSLN